MQDRTVVEMIVDAPGQRIRAGRRTDRSGCTDLGRCGQVAHHAISAIMKFVRKQILGQVLGGTADANIRFDDLRSLLTALGFVERVKGSHHIFTKAGVVEILNLQPRGSLAKPYQVRQVRSVIVRYKLAEGIQ